ncbi:MAG: PHP domain-containing protein [Patescibacteria group bacterium]
MPKKVWTNVEVAKKLRAVAAALSLSEGDNKFRIIAYNRAADAIEHASSEVKDLWDDGKLEELAGVGKTIAGYLDELFRTKKVKHWQEILSQFPEAMYELLEISGIGPVTALKFCREYGITRKHSAISKLEKIAKKEKMEKILSAITEYRNRTDRLLLDVAERLAGDVLEWMQKCSNVERIDSLGSLRRQASTVGDLDFAVCTNNPKVVLDHFTKYKRVTRIIESGDKSASVIISGGREVDLMVSNKSSYGALLQHFTGSKFHNIKLREIAMKKNFTLSEKAEFESEEALYKFFGLEYIPPELREGLDELETKIPKLLELSDIKGDLQMHSNFDINTSHDLGQSSVEELVDRSQELGYEYIGVTDHNPRVPDIGLMQKRKDYFEQINSTSVIKVFNGLEIDIKVDGRRAVPDDHLDLLDYACVSIHSSFRGDRKTQTERILQGLDHPKVKFLAHPTGRLLQEREGIEIDWDKLFDFCLRNNKWLEIDAWPNRLDLPDTQVRQAIKYGVKIVVDTDSHSAEHLRFMKYGVSVARRGWCTKADIINTCKLPGILDLLTPGKNN